MAAGVTLSRWFGHEARRVYTALQESSDEIKLRQITELMRLRGGKISIRDLMRADFCYQTADDAAQTLMRLVAAGVARRDVICPGPRGGQPHGVFVLIGKETANEQQR